ncbi:MAG TPA: UDP-N-acetylmuramoyl-L-alanyl-D-glutamate--2,6-diaminopimelate ligase [Gammaproteobacteria bacterium]|nr:UDP-N-acetylmuramoyl-L-alanyl-D-glutamate--2,6-diaminopimelate ligase [Gammaproteobacteria bacterium]
MTTTLETSQINSSALLSDFTPWANIHTPNITGLSSDSRETKPGDLFIACAGPINERWHYIEQAISRGAIAALIDTEMVDPSQKPASIPIIPVPDLIDKVGFIAARFYGEPSEDMQIIGITGTNGKTSCSQFIARALQQAGMQCGVMGTLGSGFPDDLTPGSLTTPDPITLQRQLAHLKQRGAKAVAMEVSSHSLAQKRVAGVQFKYAVFTNLSQDHLDYHKDMEHYGAAKRELFLQPDLEYAIFNTDDNFGGQLLREFTTRLPCYSYGLETSAIVNKRIQASQIRLTSHGMSAQITSPWGKGALHTHLLGRFNLSNLLAVLSTLGVMGIPLPDILHYLATLPGVPGRMQTFGGGKLPLVVVDYSHTPDALEKALLALREHCHGTLWCVFGCGGNRDPSKRKLMGQIAERFSDQIIITDDNPRFEDPAAITENIIEGLLCPWAAEIEHDRHTAIAHAIDCAHTGDVILIAGKGHETYQQVGAIKIPFNDAEQVQMQLQLKQI